MTSSAERKSAHDRLGKDPAPTGILVWQQITNWVWASECGRFKIERFIPGAHERIGSGPAWPDRYRVLKHTPEWYADLGSEHSLAEAQRVCEGLT